ncbi:MAG: DNA polymerase III subunit delta', partial [Hyphomicrobiales bacterium]|nr:DNA polymerase III subunit delta' [Hyphomicrobiales bacterium]
AREAAFGRRVDALLDALPRIDWREAHSIADKVNLRAGEAEYETLKARLEAWLGAQVRAGAVAGAGPARLAPVAELWNRMRTTAREAEALNLDKKPLVLSLLADLSTIARAR